MVSQMLIVMETAMKMKRVKAKLLVTVLLAEPEQQALQRSEVLWLRRLSVADG